jgi:hypothetical protein
MGNGELERRQLPIPHYRRKSDRTGVAIAFNNLFFCYKLAVELD